MLIDAHAHMEWNTIQALIPEIIIRAKQVGVEKIISSVSRMQDYQNMEDLVKKYPNCLYWTLGIHPEYALDPMNDFENYYEFFQKYRKDIIGIGEIGLDYVAIKDHEQRQKCEKVFRDMLDFATREFLPVVIHCRNAEKQALNILKEFNQLKSVLLHCFGGPDKFIQQGLERGYYFSIPTSITHKPLHQHLAAQVPLDHILLETDSPFLPPFPDITQNEPQYVKIVAEEIAKIKHLSFDEVAAQTTLNAKAFFSLH
jgi:TatD DNase family protein